MSENLKNDTEGAVALAVDNTISISDLSEELRAFQLSSNYRKTDSTVTETETIPTPKNTH